MKVIITGATGMVGAGVLQTALNAADVERVLVVGRQPTGVTHEKLQELILPDLFEVSGIENMLHGYDACIWAIGISSSGMDEAAYAHITETLTLKWAKMLLRINPGISFCYCSAAGAGGKSMWARVRQRVESELLRLPFRHAGAVRPGIIRPAPGARSRTPRYRIVLRLLTPLFLLSPVWLVVVPSLFTTSDILGRAMLSVVRGKATSFILETADINRLGR
ncbi:TPA: epimerase [Klebsiella aerogenes]|nr:epimerase [Klebsiella aerogenes]ELT6135497.1 epimerase [Klebsiella aerogenes]HCR0827121.1 epimerase [Klebsiella aerogenes]HDS3820090.1 epimerase [Klebsiella aerogenes]